LINGFRSKDNIDYFEAGTIDGGKCRKIGFEVR